MRPPSHTFLGLKSSWPSQSLNDDAQLWPRRIHLSSWWCQPKDVSATIEHCNPKWFNSSRETWGDIIVSQAVDERGRGHTRTNVEAPVRQTSFQPKPSACLSILWNACPSSPSFSEGDHICNQSWSRISARYTGLGQEQTNCIKILSPEDPLEDGEIRIRVGQDEALKLSHAMSQRLISSPSWCRH